MDEIESINNINHMKNKKKVHSLLDKYGTLENFHQNSTMLEDLEYQFAQGDDSIEEVEQERQIMSSLPKTDSSSLDDTDMAKNASIYRARNRQNTFEDITTTPTMDNAFKIESMKTKLSNLGYYRGKIDSTITPGFYKAISDYSEDNPLNNTNMNNRLLQAYEKLSKINNPSRIDFDGEYLRFVENGNTILELPAMSGNPNFQERKYQNLKNKGPLPEGNYRVKQNNVQDIENSIFEMIGRGKAPGGWSSWGKHRVWLTPFSSNTMHGRDNFSIHGGKSLGSAGCIDLACQEEEFFDKFKKYGRDMIINVHYPKEKLR